MKDEIEKAIKALLAKVNGGTASAPEALNYTQAALNLAHTLQVWKESEK